MEGSFNSKNVNNYEVLSKYYDALLIGDEDFSLWLKYIEQESFTSVLELASGSGVLAGQLMAKGYDVVASDISLDMKNASLSNYNGEYLILNMIEYQIDRKFDLIICICDSINYLELHELDNFIKCAYEHLNENGRLIFDMHSIKRIDEFKTEYIEEGYIDETAYQWSIVSDAYDNSLYQHFTFYDKDGMIQEHHLQNIFEVEDVEKKMSKYFKTEIINDFVIDEKVLFIGRKL